jgi:hypothetical protein
VADEDQQVRAGSDDLLRALDELKELESQKRAADSSTPRFHELADRVEHQARMVMEIAGQREPDGHGPEGTDMAVDEVQADDATDR